MKKSLYLGAIFLIAGVSGILAQVEKQWDPGLMELAPALQEAGFDRNSLDSLLLAARHDSVLVRQGAAYGLQFFQSPATIRELLRLVDDPEAAIAIMACQSLAKLNDTSWIGRARARLGSFQDGHDQVAMASALAKAGDYTGWPLIKENLTRANYAPSALYSAQFFIGMKDSEGKPIDIAQEIELFATHIEPSARTRLSAVVSSIRKEQARRASGIPSR